jgi:acid phosphatase type 7
VQHLPVESFSVESWVCVRATHPDGAIVGAFQDNGSFEKGWLLGLNRTHFNFAVSTLGGDDDRGDGVLTYLAGRTPIELNRWHHVVGTYDGTTMRLYVDGQLDAESTAQSGAINYPPKAPVVIAAYQDDNESNPLDGIVHRVKLYDRALTADEIAAVVAKNQNMLTYRQDPTQMIQFLVKPYLQFATQTSMVVMSETDRPTTMTVEYGKHQPLSTTARFDGVKNLGEVTLDGLEPQTTYFYRVIRTDPESGDEVRSDILSFQTAVRDDMPWSFGVIGDTQRNPAITRKCAEGIFGLRPNIVVHCGDVVDDGHAKNQWLKDFFEPMSRLLSHAAIFPVLGNHENDSHFYYDYFSLPTPEYWYTFTYGNAQFFMIDTNRPTQPGSEQYRWLEEQLAKSTATWKIAIHHHPAYSSDNDDYWDSLKGAADRPLRTGDPKAQPLIALYEKHGIDLALAGHIHSYERTWPVFEMKVNLDKGIQYIVSGGGGGGLEQAAPTRMWFTKHVKSAHHYCFATVHGDTIEFSAYDTEGVLFDRFTLTKRKE